MEIGFQTNRVSNTTASVIGYAELAFASEAIQKAHFLMDCFAALAMTDAAEIALTTATNHHPQTVVIARSAATKQSILSEL